MKCTIAEPDPKAKAVLLEKQKENIIILMESIIDYSISLSTSNCKKYLSKKMRPLLGERPQMILLKNYLKIRRLMGLELNRGNYCGNKREDILKNGCIKI